MVYYLHVTNLLYILPHTLKNKFKALIGFIQQFMNLAASHLASREELQRATERERFLIVGQGSYQKKKKIISGLDDLPMREERGLCGR